MISLSLVGRNILASTIGEEGLIPPLKNPSALTAGSLGYFDRVGTSPTVLVPPEAVSEKIISIVNTALVKVTDGIKEYNLKPGIHKFRISPLNQWELV
jgi:hypothetical protein